MKKRNINKRGLLLVIMKREVTIFINNKSQNLKGM